jgi:hypothetical protein
MREITDQSWAARRADPHRYHPYDAAFELLFEHGGKQYSVADRLLQGDFAAALRGCPKAARAMLKIIRLNHKVRSAQQRPPAREFDEQGWDEAAGRPLRVEVPPSLGAADFAPRGAPAFDLPFAGFLEEKVQIPFRGELREMSRLDVLFEKMAELALSGNAPIHRQLVDLIISEQYRRHTEPPAVADVLNCRL